MNRHFAIPLFLNKDGRNLHAVMKKVIIFTAFLLPFLTGYGEYEDAYQHPRWAMFINGMIMGAPFSIGLWLSTIRSGRRYKYITLIVMIVSVLLRFSFLLPFSAWITLPLFLIELYAMTSLFISEKKL